MPGVMGMAGHYWKELTAMSLGDFLCRGTPILGAWHSPFLEVDEEGCLMAWDYWQGRGGIGLSDPVALIRGGYGGRDMCSMPRTIRSCVRECQEALGKRGGYVVPWKDVPSEMLRRRKSTTRCLLTHRASGTMSSGSLTWWMSSAILRKWDPPEMPRLMGNSPRGPGSSPGLRSPSWCLRLSWECY
jgi:hypothetical protein